MTFYMYVWYIRLVAFILAFFPKFDMISEILVHWITLLTAFSHCLGSTLNQTFIMHRLVFNCCYPWNLLPILNVLHLFCRFGLTTALSHHLGRQSTSWNAGVRSVCITSLFSSDVGHIFIHRHWAFLIYVALVAIWFDDLIKAWKDMLIICNIYYLDGLNLSWKNNFCASPSFFLLFWRGTNFSKLFKIKI